MANIHTTEKVAALTVSSPAFKNNDELPRIYSCDGEDINPPLHIDNLPAGTRSLALIVDDPDAPRGTWVHWLVWNIRPVQKILENSIPGIQGTTDFRLQKYNGPCPPSGIHHYHFKVYALDAKLDLSPIATCDKLKKAMEPHIIGFGEIVAVYGKK